MTRTLNLDDIQGNITRAYGRFSYPFARYFFFNISDANEGRKFVDAVRREVTTAQRWTPSNKPACTVNIAFTFFGLYKLQLPYRTLQGMPDVFVDGMKARAFALGDRDVTKTESETSDWDKHWDLIWQRNRATEEDAENQNVHVWISLNAQVKTTGATDPVDDLEAKTKWLRGLCKASKGGVRLLSGHGKDDKSDFQSASAVFDDFDGVKLPTPQEHFGFADGISDPVFEGQYPDDLMKARVRGRGKRINGRWEPLATGEFILGHPDESQELPPTAMPPEFMRNGSFMVFRKLHENVGTFARVVEEEAALFAKEWGLKPEVAKQTLLAKMCGRWTDGVSMAVAPTYEEWQALREEKGMNHKDPVKALENQHAYITSPEASDFRYADDMQGLKCPGGAHVRRVNTRDYLDPLNKVGIDAGSGAQYANNDATSQLNKRRRILRRGLPYGPHAFEKKSDKTDQGVAMMMIGASIFRQFEFVQQQWIQYGLDFNQGNNTCPMLGDHTHHTRFTIPAAPSSGNAPYVMSRLKTFVECRGGDYFFIPSLTALRMIAMGIVDPT